MDVTFGLDINQHHQTWEQLVDRTLFAEAAGFSNVWAFDHFKPLYADPVGPCFEAWTLLAGLATITSTVRLGTLVSGMTYRHPSMLATEAVTIDHLSNGRLELAVGASWFQPEHDELGFEFPSVKVRAERLEESIQVMRLLMTTDDATFEGKHYQLAGATYRPRPIQQPHVPVWIGANGEQLMLPIVGRQADVWHTFAGDPATLSRKRSIVSKAAELVGRDPGAIAVSTSLSLDPDLDQIRSTIESLSNAGVTHFTVGWPGEGQSKVEAFAEAIL